MFTGSFGEATGSQQEINDISADAFEELLHFIYTGELRNDEFPAEELIMIADRYEVADLVKLCEMKLLHHGINNNNAELIYHIANIIQCNTEIKKVAFDVLQS